VFWKPGDLGWEGRLQETLQQRRAAQLAAAAETAGEQPDLLSSSPEDPLLERWLQRQAAAEGARLDSLRRRFWQEARIGRLDRVLVLEAHSLLWALDPLQATGEGVVVITVSTPADQERLEAQLQLLDRLRRPRLLLVPPTRPGELAAQLEEGHRFEWIAARQPFHGLTSRAVESRLKALSALAAPLAQARFLFSQPLLGPAASLRAHLQRPAVGSGAGGRSAETNTESALLNEALPLENRWLDPPGSGSELVHQGLKRLDWQVQAISWQESLDLPLGESLVLRWFAPEADYRRQLGRDLAKTTIDDLEALFRLHRGATLPQRLAHTLVQACRRE
jgi:putative ATPase